MTDDAGTELGALAAALAAHVERRRWLGATRTARASEPAASETATGERAHEAARSGASATPPAAPRPPAAAGVPAPAGAAPPTAAIAAGCADLEALRAAVAGCRACPLADTRTQTVFADGSGRAGVLFIGEAPGENEDRQGVPFVGRAGQLLTDIITKGMGLAREDVAIANVLKCRPPGNRDPEPDEKACCTPFLDRQIELLDPRVIITLGLHASRHVLASDESMGRLRGRVHRREGRKVVATYHPAYLLRSPGMKKACWEDIQLAMHELGLTPPARPAPPAPPGRDEEGADPSGGAR